MSVRILEIPEATHPISSAIPNAYIDFSKMTCSLGAVVTDAISDGRRVVGDGFYSNGRYGQGGLVRERFAPRVLEAGRPVCSMRAAATSIPDRIWATRRAIAVRG
jgi:D(-)-tartrate dehydratase